MIRDALKTIFLVNASFGVAIAIFYELVKLCNQVGVSPWWAGFLYAGGYVALLIKECKASLQPHNHGE